MTEITEFVDAVQNLEALGTQYSEGDIVQTPQGVGVVSGVWTSSWEGDGDETVEASENSPAYTVALKDEQVGFEHYKASQLSEGKIETDVEDPVDDVEAMIDIERAINGSNWEALDWTMPDSWEESETSARVILLDVWSSLGGQFNCGGACCMGEFHDAEFCAAMKDATLNTEAWRGWGPD